MRKLYIILIIGICLIGIVTAGILSSRESAINDYLTEKIAIDTALKTDLKITYEPTSKCYLNQMGEEICEKCFTYLWDKKIEKGCVRLFDNYPIEELQKDVIGYIQDKKMNTLGGQEWEE